MAAHVSPKRILIEESGQVQIIWGLKIPLRDGVHLAATLYLPGAAAAPAPTIFTLTPYVGQKYHDYAMYFAANGLPFLTIDVRGRGNSEGSFWPTLHEGRDGFDIVEWVARQKFCNGNVAMWGGSYGGAVQWATAAQAPPPLSTIAPASSPYIGVDFPMRCNIAPTYLMQWLMLVFGRTSQERIFGDDISFWNGAFSRWCESGAPFKDLDTFLGNPSPIFRTWVAHPHLDEYLDSHNPTLEQYAKISVPVLTITGSYDDAQLGALTHHRKHVISVSTDIHARHYLVIGPWDHAGTREPQLEFAGIKCGPASLVDLNRLHLDWFRWTMAGGAKPSFLVKNVVYYVMGAESWKYADTIEKVTASVQPLFLSSTVNAVDVVHSGSMSLNPSTSSQPDTYVYDPRDLTHLAIEAACDPRCRTDQRLAYHLIGKQLIYHSEPFERAVEISGFFKLEAWIAINQPDTDLRASIFAIDIDGSAIYLSGDFLRARYRESFREQKLIHTEQPLLYQFCNFTFISRQLRKGSRLRLIIGPVNSIFFQKNHNTGGVVSEESIGDARPVVVRLFHDEKHRSALYVPYGAS